MQNKTLSLSGAMAKKFLDFKIAPVLIVLSLFLGLYALIYTPAEEDPQINITLIDIVTHYDGAEPKEVEKRITVPMENIISKVKGIKNIYSISKASTSVVSVEFELGENRIDAITDVYAAVFEQYDRLSSVSAIKKPIIKPRSIDDVPILSYVLYSDNFSLEQITNLAHSIKSELYQYKEIREIEVKSAYERSIRIFLDTSKMAKFEVSASDISRILKEKNVQTYVGDDVRNNLAQQLWVGNFIDKNQLKTLKSLVLKELDGYTLRLQDVCVNISYQNNIPSSYQHFIIDKKHYDFVNISISKEPGVSAIDLAKKIDKKVQELQKSLTNNEVKIEKVRNYGKSAQDKVTHLSQKLLIVIAIVMILVLITMGVRAAIVVALATLITLSLTLFSANILGFTFNQVSLFALIFSIGILVDDAIVVVENIHRQHVAQGEFNSRLIANAVDEVGKPTIIATLAVIITLLPMAFVSGLMGPYMSPIPINASIGMALSLVVAFTFTPWMVKKIGLSKVKESDNKKELLSTFFVTLNLYFIDKTRRKVGLIASITILVMISFAFVGLGWVNLKMLPHDNKQEIQIILDADENVPLEKTDAILQKIATRVDGIEEINSIQIYTGLASPINFNGLMRQYYFRKAPYLGELVITLNPKNERDRSSHQVATILRQELVSIIEKEDVSIKVVEVPPGPPVLSPIVAEVYANNIHTQENLALNIVDHMKEEKNIADIDSSINADIVKKFIYVDEEKARRYNISPQDVLFHISALMGKTIAYVHNEQFIDQIPIIMSVEDHKKNLEYLLQTKVNGVFLKEIIKIESTLAEKDIFHKNLKRVAYVFGDVKSEHESPLYAMFSLSSHIDVVQYFFSVKEELDSYIKYDGEWQITMETFRDMAIAYLVGLFFLYLLLVMQYKSYLVPLIIMSPIPLTIVGVIPGHFMFNAAYTATSMIGMIALAGIIVRNSVLLVDFIESAMNEGSDMKSAIVGAIEARTRPILITAVASMLGAFFILSDPVFEGMAISLIFGILVATFLTLLVIPLLYSMVINKKDVNFNKGVKK